MRCDPQPEFATRATNNVAGHATQQSAAGFVRPLEERDIPRVAELHEAAFRKTAQTSSLSRRTRLSQLLLQHPWRAESLPSWVFQESGGNVVGCLGVIPRPMWFNGRKILAAVSHSFVVEPGSRSTLAAMELAKRFFAGPQDLSLAEGGDASRRIWMAVGGSVSLLYGLCWTRPLQPSRYALSFLRNRGLSPALGWMLRPLCRLVDALAPLTAKSFRLRESAVAPAELDARALSESVSEFTRDRSLRPRYDEDACEWLLNTLAQEREHGTLQKTQIRNAQRETIGWCLYYANPGGINTVIQVGAKPGCVEQVLDHIFHCAKQQGAVAVSGQVDPAFFSVLARKDCLFHHDGGSWMLVHSRHSELMQAIHRGDAFLTRLEGEWWISRFLS